MISKLARGLASINTMIGKIVAWSTLLMVLIMNVVIFMRVVFHWGSIATQESVGYLHAFLILFGIGYTYQYARHVRVDVLFEKFNEQTQWLITRTIHLCFTMPVACALMYFTFNYSYQSWKIGEGSREAGGIPYLYLIKIGLFIMPLLLLIEAVSQVLKSFGERR